MNHRPIHPLLVLCVLLALVVVPVAAASPGAVVRDCAQDGSLDGTYSDADKRAALGRIPADVDEYSDCRALIRGAIGGRPKARANSGDPPASKPAGASKPRAASADGAGGPRAVRRPARKVRKAPRKPEGGAINRTSTGAAENIPDAAAVKASSTSDGAPHAGALAIGVLALVALTGVLLALFRGNPVFAAAVRRLTAARFRR